MGLKQNFCYFVEESVPNFR